jgi:cyclophilin family peptidyl-prolyl cis-trans isomerase
MALPPEHPEKEVRSVKKLILAAVLLVAFGCKPGSQETPAPAATDTAVTSTATATETTATAAPATATDSAQPGTPEGDKEKVMSNPGNTVAEIHTTKGQINIRFFPDVAPNHVKNFIDLAQQGFYDGTKFHRVIPGFMIQGGDPNTKNGSPDTWGTGGSPNRLKAEFNSKPHRRGIVSMARSQHPDSASSQFFIVVKDSNFLDNQYTVFGEVLKGMDVADQIVSAPKGAQDRPNDPVAITKIVVREAAAGEIGQ